ncbi:restriction endonuclease subunit S [Vibrio parahaemolyticus]|uniref:restriction endonuclease subunit S n=1 Tax=Vibrio parahaemolyticus TaxID=670 RepID=UPI00112284FB|nr:restriction endonuclease subunit S [Vibrio parahaemolyticus]MBM5169447.1 restriction endonuclease subunit S [Vibrio parahaemolyticus]MCR9972869.1 restriction endonuclease subunit S [Vibrio parahaemolyticus]MCS0019319.1 restriction endonuclease subunit S [Vibrio parahaemolyticus]MCS0057371.1 restriction endonuclease subunit S [Vibrio parahaemolyticus]MCX8845111.1 restriction endonuclease subunit S [Vibrio parahaemolyticus]
MAVENLITEHIDIWTSAEKTRSTSGRGSSKKLELYGVKKLRELILELAVRGKLVPQDPNDEPASVLLERIAAEKTQLVKEKKIKKQKALPEVTEQEAPFNVPKGWEWTRLGNLSSDIHYGYTASAKPNSEGVRLLRITDIQNDKVNWGTVPACDITEEKAKSYLLENDDILIARTGGTIGKSYLVENIDLQAVFASYLIRVKRVQAVYAPFTKVFLGSQLYWKQLIENSAGTGQPNVNATALKQLLFIVPPFNQQKRIVAKVDELMALCDQLEQQTEASIEAHQVLVTTLLDTLTNSADADELMQNWTRISEHFDTLFTTEESIDQLKQTILQLAVMGKLVSQDPNDEPAAELLKRIAEEKAQLVKEKKIKKQKALPPISEDEKPFELPSGWEWERIGTFGVVGTGATPSRSNPKYWDDPKYNWVSSGETSELFVSTTKEKVSELAIQETNVSIYPSGTLIVAMYGQGKTRGQITELTEPAGTNQACAAIQLIEKNESHKDFVKLYFRKSYEELRSNAAGGAQPNLNVGKVQSTVIAVPPLNEQQRINTKVNELLTVCDHLKAHFEAVQSTQLHLTDAIVEQAL